jgi:hypothetical protein
MYKARVDGVSGQSRVLDLQDFSELHERCLATEVAAQTRRLQVDVGYNVDDAGLRNGALRYEPEEGCAGKKGTLDVYVEIIPPDLGGYLSDRVYRTLHGVSV